MPADRKQVEELTKELRAKAWQSSTRRNKAGGLSRPADHVCARAANAIEAILARAEAAESILRDCAECIRDEGDAVPDDSINGRVLRHVAAHQQPAPVKAGGENNDG